MFNQFKSYCKKFANDESGMELLQLAIVVTITVGLIAVVVRLQSVIANQIDSAADSVENDMTINGVSEE